MVLGFGASTQKNGKEKELSWNPEKYLTLQLQFLKFGGILPSKNITSSPWKLKIYNVISFISVLWFLPCLGLQITAFIMNEKSFSGKLDVAFEITASFNQFVISLYMLIERKIIQDLIAKVEIDFKDLKRKLPLGAEHFAILVDGYKESQKFSTIFCSGNMVTLFLWTMLPLVKYINDNFLNPKEGEQFKFSWEHFGFKTWLPPNPEDPSVYSFIWVYGFIGVYVLLVENAGYNSLYFAMTLYASYHFKVLNTLIQNVDQYITKSKSKFDDDNANGEFSYKQDLDEEQNRKVSHNTRHHREEIVLNLDEKLDNLPEAEEYLVNCVKYHQALLSFCDDVETVFSPLLFMFFTLNGTMMCLTVYHSSVGGGDGGYSKFVLAMITVWVPMYLMCWFGERLTEQTEAVATSAYGCQWYNSTQRFKEYTQFLIMRAQKSVKLTAGNFFIVSLEGFASIAHTAYAYYTFLKQSQEAPE